MREKVLLVLMSVILLGCGSDDSKPGVKPGIPSPPKTSTKPSDPKPPTDSTKPPVVPDTKPTEDTYELLPGIYEGTTEQREIAEGLIDDNKRLWVIYSDNDSDRDVLGFVNTNGNIVGNNGEFSVKGKNYSYDARDALDTTITGDYRVPKIINGSVFGLPVNATTYNLKYNENLSKTKQKLTDINNKKFTGIAYITGDTEAGTLSIEIDQDGNFTGKDQSGCNMSGKFIPSSSQRYFESTVIFGGYPCYAPRETITGVALLNEDNELIVLGTDANKAKGIYFAGE